MLNSVARERCTDGWDRACLAYRKFSGNTGTCMAMEAKDLLAESKDGLAQDVMFEVVERIVQQGEAQFVRPSSLTSCPFQVTDQDVLRLIELTRVA